MVMARRNLMGGKALPYDYAVQYIELGGWILYLEGQSRGDQVIECRTTASTTGTEVLFGYNPWAGIQNGYWSTGNGRDVPIQISSDTFYLAKIDGGHYTVDGSTVKDLNVGDSTQNRVFAYVNNINWNGKVASLKRMIKSTGVITHDLLACVKDGMAAFYNAANETFIIDPRFVAGPKLGTVPIP